MKAPAFQFYPADFIMGTAEMTAEEVGGYIRGLCHQWAKEGLPNNRKKLEAILGIHGESLDCVLEKFALDTDGRLKNARLERVREQQNENRKKNQENAKKRWDKNKTDDAVALPPHMPNQCQSDALLTSTSTSTLITSTTPASDVLNGADAPQQKEKKIEAEDQPKEEKKEKLRTPAPKFQKPTYEELLAYMEQIHPGSPQAKEQAQRFLNYYDGNGWKVGRNPMKDWKATARNWKFPTLPIFHDPQNEAGKFQQTPKSEFEKRMQQNERVKEMIRATHNSAA